MTDPLAAVLAAALSDAQRRYRSSNRLGALCIPTIPVQVIDQFAEALVPVLRELVRDLVTEITATSESADTPKPLPLAG